MKDKPWLRLGATVRVVGVTETGLKHHNGHTGRVLKIVEDKCVQLLMDDHTNPYFWVRNVEEIST